jgi:hypothetical protein
LDEGDAEAAAKQYEGLGLAEEDIKIGIMSESECFTVVPVHSSSKLTSSRLYAAIFICPTYYLLQAYQRNGKPRWKAEMAIPPGSHGEDVAYYFTS